MEHSRSSCRCWNVLSRDLRWVRDDRREFCCLGMKGLALHVYALLCVRPTFKKDVMTSLAFGARLDIYLYLLQHWWLSECTVYISCTCVETAIALGIHHHHVLQKVLPRRISSPGVQSKGEEAKGPRRKRNQQSSVHIYRSFSPIIPIHTVLLHTHAQPPPPPPPRWIRQFQLNIDR